MKTKMITLLISSVMMTLFGQVKADPPLTRTYYITNGTSQSCGLWEYKVSDIDSLNMLLIGDVGSIPQINSYDEILFKCGERYYGQVDIADSSIAVGLTFSSYETGAKPIIDGSFETFIFPDSCSVSTQYLGFYEYELKSSNIPSNILNVYAGDTELILAREPNIDEETVSGFIGFNKITSVSNDNSKLVFNDATNFAGGQIVLKKTLWNYWNADILDNLGATDLAFDSTVVNYGFFVQNHINALDDTGEWFYDSENNILYLKPFSEGSCNVSIVGCNTYAEDGGCGFYIKDQGSSGITIENLDIRNARECIYINNSDYVTVDSCTCTNSLVGIDAYESDYCSYINNNFKNLNSWGIICQGDNNTIGSSGNSNYFRDIGLKLGYDRSLFYSPGSSTLNLNAIQTRGSYNNISYNFLDNIGYCGIKYQPVGDVCTDNVIDNNTIDSIGVTLADCGGVYTWQNFGTGNRITNNDISYVLGDLNGTPKYSSSSLTGHARGIYMDALSCNMTIESNDINNCSAGLVLQNGRNNTVRYNTIKNSKEFELLLIHSGWIINGGSGNPDDDINFAYSQPSTNFYTINDSLYYWDADKKTLQNATTDSSATSTYVYVTPGDNNITENEIGTSSQKNDDYYTFKFSTWQEVNDNTLYDLTGDSLGISNNLETGVDLDDISVSIRSADVWYPATNEIIKVGYEQYGTEFDDNELLNVGELDLSITTGRKVK